MGPLSTSWTGGEGSVGARAETEEDVRGTSVVRRGYVEDRNEARNGSTALDALRGCWPGIFNARDSNN